MPIAKYNEIQIGQANHDHLYRLLIADQINEHDFVQQFAEFYFQHYYQKVCQHNNYNHAVDQFKALTDQLNQYYQELIPIHKKYDTLSDTERAPYSRDISNKYNQKLRELWNAIINSDIMIYLPSQGHPQSRVHWKTINKLVAYTNQTLEQIIIDQITKHHPALMRYAQRTFAISHELDKESFQEFLTQHHYSSKDAHLIISNEFDQILNINTDTNSQKITTEIYDDYY